MYDLSHIFGSFCGGIACGGKFEELKEEDLRMFRKLLGRTAKLGAGASVRRLKRSDKGTMA